MAHVDNWTQCNENIHVLLVEFRIRHHGHEHLSSALAMADVRNLVNARNLHYLLPKRGLIIETHLVETVVEKLLSLPFNIRIDVSITILRVLYIEEFVLLGVLIPPGIVQPDVEAGLDQPRPDRLLLVDQKGDHGIVPPVLTYDHRLLLDLVVAVGGSLWNLRSTTFENGTRCDFRVF